MPKRRPARPSTRAGRRGVSRPARQVRASLKTARRTHTPAKLMSGKVVARRGAVTVSEVDELDALRREIERAATSASPLRWNANPDDVQRSVAQLVLTLVEFIRKLLERQAIRRMEAGSLTDEQTEAVGRALMKLEETILDLARRFSIPPDDLNLDLGPVGKLM